jgi:hypothetical protein
MEWQSQRDFVYGEFFPFGEEYFGTPSKILLQDQIIFLGSKITTICLQYEMVIKILYFMF